jgi:hypothetical protein
MIARFTVKVPHVQVQVLLLVQLQNRFASFQHHPPLAGPPFSPVAQTVGALLFQPLPPPPITADRSCANDTSVLAVVSIAGQGAV